MFFRQRAAANATLSYLVGCAGHRMAIAVDVVAGDDDGFIAEAGKAGACIVHVIDTHVHADHHSGGLELARRVGAPYHLHESNRGRVGFEMRFDPMQSMPRQAFVDAVTAEIPPPPADMARIVEANLRGIVPAAARV